MSQICGSLWSLEIITLSGQNEWCLVVLWYIKYPDKVNIFCEVKWQETDNTDTSGLVSIHYIYRASQKHQGYFWNPICLCELWYAKTCKTLKRAIRAKFWLPSQKTLHSCQLKMNLQSKVVYKTACHHLAEFVIDWNSFLYQENDLTRIIQQDKMTFFHINRWMCPGPSQL